MRDQNRFFSYFIIILSLFVIFIGGYFAYGAAQEMNSGTKPPINNKEEYPLRRNATEYQKEIHKELLEAVKEKPVDKELIASLVSKNFIADYFTWTNKLQFNDVGGLYYVNTDYRKSFYDKSLDTFYHDIQFYLKDGNMEETLEVSNIKTKVEDIDVQIDDKAVPAYLVETSWSYKASEILNLEEYQTKTFIKVIEDKDGHFSVVEVNGNEEKEY